MKISFFRLICSSFDFLTNVNLVIFAYIQEIVIQRYSNIVFYAKVQKCKSAPFSPSFLIREIMSSPHSLCEWERKTHGLLELVFGVTHVWSFLVIFSRRECSLAGWPLTLLCLCAQFVYFEQICCAPETSIECIAWGGIAW